jgi:hypothetical protein
MNVDELFGKQLDDTYAKAVMGWHPEPVQHNDASAEKWHTANGNATIWFVAPDNVYKSEGVIRYVHSQNRIWTPGYMQFSGAKSYQDAHEEAWSTGLTKIENKIGLKPGVDEQQISTVYRCTIRCNKQIISAAEGTGQFEARCRAVLKAFSTLSIN